MEFYWEYMNVCDSLVERFIKQAKTINVDCFKVGEIDIQKPITNYLWETLFFSPHKEDYSRKRKLSEKEGFEFINKLYDNMMSAIRPTLESSSSILNSSCGFYEKELSDYKNSTIVYCKNNRQLEYLLPVLSQLNDKVVIISFSELDETLISSLDQVFIVETDLILDHILINAPYIQKSFERIFYQLNTLLILIQIISPTQCFLLEGPHFEQEIISSICKEYHIESICIQQGWPGLIHTRFKNMTYDIYYTWGKGFSELWKKYNSIPKFIELGYYGNTCFIKKLECYNKNAITFFFQAPLFTISDDCFENMIKFVFFCVEKFPNRRVLVREHPEYLFTKRLNISEYKNIHIVTHTPMEDVFSETEIGVSIFSSTLMECVLYGAIPFIFNLTSNPKYFPDLDSENIGIEVKCYEEAELKMNYLIENNVYREEFKYNIASAKSKYFNEVDYSILKN